jgi:hypothetical protein
MYSFSLQPCSKSLRDPINRLSENLGKTVHRSWSADQRREVQTQTRLGCQAANSTRVREPSFQRSSLLTWIRISQRSGPRHQRLDVADFRRPWFRFRRAKAFGNRLRKKDIVATDDLIVRSEHMQPSV